MDSRCFNTDEGIIKAIGSGGVAPYTYLLKQSAILSELSNVTDTAVFENYGRGSYTVILRDTNDCEVSTTVFISSPPEIKADSLSVYDPLCNKDSVGSLVIKPTGGVPYSNDKYNYELIGPNGDTTFIAQTDKAFFSKVSVGTNYYYIFDSLNCRSDLDSVLLVAPPAVTATVIKKNETIAGASDGWAVVRATGGSGVYTYRWKDSSGNILGYSDSVYNLSAGLYTVDVWDDNLCPNGNASEGYNIEVEIEAQPRVKLYVDTVINCTYPGKSDGFVSLYSTGGWSPKKYYMKDSAYALSNNFYNLAAGTYQFFVIDSIHSIDSISVTVSSADSLSIEVITKKTLCYGSSDGEATIVVSGGTSPYSYSLDGYNFKSDNTFIGLSEGSYRVFVKDVYGNQVSREFTISQPAPLALEITDTVDTKCGLANGSVSVNASGGTAPYEYSADWTGFTSSTVLDGLSAGEHLIIVKDQNGCVDSSDVFINNSDGPKIDSIQVTDARCFNTSDGSATITSISGNAPFNIIWSNNLYEDSYTNDSLPRGEHWVKVVDSKSCFTQSTFFIGSPSKVNFSFEVKKPTCYDGCNGSVSLSLSDGIEPYNFVWKDLPGQANHYYVDSLCAGVYTVECTDGLNCVYDSSVVVLNPEKIDILADDSAYICQGQSYRLDAGYPGSSYSWSSDNGFKSSSQVIDINKAGNYYVSLITPEGCTAEDTFALYVSSHYLQADFLMPDSASVGDTVVIIEISWEAPEHISWKFPSEFWVLSNTEENVQVIPTKAGVYTVSLNAFLDRCSDYTENGIVVTPASKIDTVISPENESERYIKVRLYPNPNNGIFKLEVELREADDVTVEVFDFMGRKLTKKQGRNHKYYSFDFNISGINQGIYFLRIRTNKASRSLKFIKN